MRSSPPTGSNAPVFDLTGQVAVVTGGNGGVGLAIARGLAGAGADIMIAARNDEKTTVAVDGLRAEFSVRVEHCTADVQVDADLAALVDATTQAFGRLDILVNNAGMSIRNKAEDYTLAEYDTVLDVNLKSAFRLSQLCLPLLLAAGRGKIINIASLFSFYGSGFSLPYAVSKGGLVQLTRSLAVGWAKHGIQVNAIAPGWIETDLTVGTRRHNPGFHEKVVDRTPAGRWGQPEDLAGAAVFLASRASDFVTGACLVVDGGYSIS